jgi:3'(2'), 5'-bisphosphate nucleotidase
VLRAAGGIVLAAEGGPLAYGKIASGLRNGGFVAWGDPALAARSQYR